MKWQHMALLVNNRPGVLSHVWQGSLPAGTSISNV